MTWWNKVALKEPEILGYSRLGEMIPCSNPENVVLIPVAPPPDLSTKPEDKIGYCFGYVCPKKHVNETFDSITIDGYKERRACQTCGGVAKPAVVKRISEARWVNHDRSSSYGLKPDPDWRWRHEVFAGRFSDANWMIQWTRREFLHYLDSPRSARKKK
jgi:hypothetical protein